MSLRPMAVMVCCLAGCAPPSDPTMREVTRGLDRAGGPRPAGDEPAKGVAAIVDGRPITAERLTPLLYEAAGAQALREAVLDTLLEREIARRGVALPPTAVEDERRRLIDQIVSDANAVSESAVDAENALAALRSARGLGPKRFAALLLRSARLRALVENEVVVTPDAVRAIYNIVHGEKRTARLITTATIQDAHRAIGELANASPFPEVAARVSTDVSAQRGGLIEPISLADPAYPQAIRDALARLNPGETSPPISIETGWAILRLESVAPAGGPPFAEARGEFAAIVRRRQERVLMDRLAQELLRSADVAVLDDDLARAWRGPGAGAIPPLP